MKHKGKVETQRPWWVRGIGQSVKVEKWTSDEGEYSVLTLVLSITDDGLPCVEVWEGDLEHGKDEVSTGPGAVEDWLDEVLQGFRR